MSQPPPTPSPPAAVEHGERYDSTRAAWQHIWQAASVEVELKAVRYPRSMQTIQAYLPFLAHDRPLLEAGSGLSAVVLTLRQLGYRVIGLDYAENALHVSRRYDASLPLVAGDVHALPYGDATLGAYLSFGVLEHFEHGMTPALREAYRVLMPGGTLVLTIPYPNLVYRLVRWRRRLRGEPELNDETFYESAYTRQQLVGAVEAAGFHVVLAQPTSHAFTLWGLGGVFRAPGYYQTSRLAEAVGTLARLCLPWAFNFMTLIVARK